MSVLHLVRGLINTDQRYLPPPVMDLVDDADQSSDHLGSLTGSSPVGLTDDLP